ncbi:hypothetical protein RchiOBHm_Chr1g0341771 [Rosa chinensis]|uniref:Uncharacterized protein n=1 Tax=Rosa chinensis TaxID=74649 RepID=A0A2P6SDU8_ROSCH|nr:hypothetical protein RchiOBHm_Chr1g0341771 [Rosa chinensis]
MATQSDRLQDEQMKEGTKLDLPNPFQSVANGMFHNGTFRFKGIQTPILPPLARNLFGTKDVTKQRKPVLLHSAQLKTSEESVKALALVPFDEAQVLPNETESLESFKRGRPSSPFASPKKLKFLLNDGLEGKGDTCLPLKKMKLPALRFTAQSLGLIEAPGGMLVPAEVAMPKAGTKTEQAATKKKRGRPLGSRNKNPPKSKKVPVEEVLSTLYSGKPPSPSLKGKEKF